MGGRKLGLPASVQFLSYHDKILIDGDDPVVKDLCAPITHFSVSGPKFHQGTSLAFSRKDSSATHRDSEDVMLTKSMALFTIKIDTRNNFYFLELI